MPLGPITLGPITVVAIAVVAISVIAAAVTFFGGDSGGAASSRRTIVWTALGDSFASGEGAEPPSGWPDACHRSTTAYADQAAAELRRGGDDVQLTVVACTGATTAALTSSFKGQPPQIDGITPGTNLVTLTMGGNDAGFVELVAGCILSVESCPPSDWAIRLAELDVALSFAVEAIINDGDLADGAMLVLLGYPQILPDDRSCVPFSDAGRTGGRGIVSDINSVIADVGARYASQRVEVLDPNSSARWVGHEACPAPGSEPFVNPLSFLAARSAAPLHPNVDGHAAYAADLVALIESGS